MAKGTLKTPPQIGLIKTFNNYSFKILDAVKSQIEKFSIKYS